MRTVTFLTAAAALMHAPRANACGCLALPNPATQVVQAGERILFAHDQGQVIAYIQVQYAGTADQFAWLVPLPSLPTLELGTDEVFTALQEQTRPLYWLTTRNVPCMAATTPVAAQADSGGCGARSFHSDGGRDLSAAGVDLSAGPLPDLASQTPLVLKSSVGPYDYAVLKADSQKEMTDWLAANRYFVPAGTDQALTPYIRPGAYFLALKLKSGQTTGDITPIIVRYSSDLPMIPIILTQVGAVPNMGIQVWILGNARAIPRNYYHVLLNEMAVWLGLPYQDAVTNAVKEAPKRHAFVTEYAGSSAVMQNRLYNGSRYGDLAVLRTLTRPSQYLAYLKQYRYLFDSTLVAILGRYIPIPEPFKSVPAADFYQDYDYYIWGAAADAGVSMIDAAALTDEIDVRIVQPAKNTQALFDRLPYLTRLYSALSPEDMTDDPVFSENPELPNVSRVHEATVTIPCRGDAWLTNDQGMIAQYRLGGPTRPSMPASVRIQVLREEGPPQTVVDNSDAIQVALGPVKFGDAQPVEPSVQPPVAQQSGCACDVRAKAGDAAAASLVVGALIALWARRRRTT